MQLSRTHNIDGIEEACDLADETGLMLKVEEADVAQVNFTFDQAYWNAAFRHEVAMVDAYRNHPSVVLRSAGNENNLWNWLYQGEAATTMGHRWQMKTCNAMREFDLMRRPIEWESDSDLKGEWQYYALHYPRELSRFPDVPNGAWWGAWASNSPLDGKTVVPYSAYPITLGSKPITVGESFEPGVLNQPFGQSILLGDAAYLGGNYWWEGWNEASRFFINGFRDVEFVLIDTYNALALQKPQTVILKQESRSFVGGQRLKRQANVHSDLRRGAELVLRWSLSWPSVSDPAVRTTGSLKAAGRSSVSVKGLGQRSTPTPSGEVKVPLEPAELKRLTLDIPLPAVRQRTEATFRVELLEGSRLVHTEARDWQIHPPFTVRAPAGLKLAVYDPLGQTSAMLAKLKVPFTPVTDLQAAVSDTGDTRSPAQPFIRSLLLGRDALKQPPEGPWREALTAFVREGGKVLLLEQSESPDFLPTPLTQAAGRGTTIAFVRATDHPILSGLSDADLRWWAASRDEDEHYVSRGNCRKPIRGNYLPLIDAGAADGIVETPLLEEYEGKGSFILCQMLLTDKATVSPAACALLQNLLGYLASPQCYGSLGATALLAKADSPLHKALGDSRLMFEDPTGKASELTAGKFRTAILDAATGLDAAAADALKAFAASGGHVMLHRATPAQQPGLESLLGTHLRFFPLVSEPMDIQYHVFCRSNAGLMAGISNHEFFWTDNACLAEIRHNGCWWSWYKCQPEETIADYFVSPGDAVPADRALPLMRPGALLQVPVGSGYFLLNQLRLDEPHPDVAVTASRLRALLLTNLGCTLRSEGNNRERVYLQNLAFIAQQKKTGMWGEPGK